MWSGLEASGRKTRLVRRRFWIREFSWKIQKVKLAYSFLVCFVGLGLMELSVVECVGGSMEEGGCLSESFESSVMS